MGLLKTNPGDIISISLYLTKRPFILEDFQFVGNKLFLGTKIHFLGDFDLLKSGGGGDLDKQLCSFLDKGISPDVILDLRIC